MNRLDEPVLMAVLKPMQTEFGIYHRLESCEALQQFWVHIFKANVGRSPFALAQVRAKSINTQLFAKLLVNPE